MADDLPPDPREHAFGELFGGWPSDADAPEGFDEWVRNLHDVYLNVEFAWLASVHVPPSEVEQDLERLGGSRRQRLARFLARDMWVLWEAWDRRSHFHDAFEERAPAAVAQLRNLEKRGQSKGWFKRLRNVRDYMNHRDQREYDDPGRAALPDDAIEWLDELRRAFSQLLLSAMGLPPVPPALDTHEFAKDSNASIRELAVSSVDEMLTATVAAMGVGSEGPSDTAAEVTAHFGRAFTQAVCASPHLWTECLTALVRRSVTAWTRLDQFQELRAVLSQADFGEDADLFMIAVTAELPEQSLVPMAERSKLAVHRVTDWFNGHGDLIRTMTAAVAVAVVFTSAASTIEDDTLEAETFVAALGAEADRLLTS